MKKVLITMLTLGILSANAGGYVNGGLGFGMHKSNEEDDATYNRYIPSVKPKGLMLTIGAGHNHDLQNNLFLGWGFDIGMSMAKKTEKYTDKYSGDEEELTVKAKKSIDTYFSFGYKVNDAFSAYTKLGLGATEVSAESKDVLSGKSRSSTINVMGFIFGLGMNYMVDAKGAVYAELLMKKQKISTSDDISDFKFDTMPALTVGYRYFF